MLGTLFGTPGRVWLLISLGLGGGGGGGEGGGGGIYNAYMDVPLFTIFWIFRLLIYYYHSFIWMCHFDSMASLGVS